MAYQSYQGIETPEIRAWKRRNADATPQWMVKIAQDMPESTLPVMMLPGLVGRAGVELFYETVQLAGDVVKFNINEIERFTKGQETLTVKAIMLMSKFVGEEAARIAAKEDPASFEIAKNLALNFNHLEMEDQVKAGAKLALSLFATPTGIARVAKVSGENAEKALQLVAQVEKVTALPAAPLRINPPRAAKQWPSQPLMFSVEAKVSAQGGLATYEAAQGAQDKDWLLRAADEALFQAKKSGKNRTQVWALPSETTVPSSTGVRRGQSRSRPTRPGPR